MLTDFAISGDRNVIKREAEILNYKELNSRHTAYIECKTKATPLIRGVTGTSSK
jgi:hypothetical protein